ncbi:phospholipase B1, membrane-associated-like [Watersipora subatra]|uniref:phospholipase B1, membrane-associated-like n=1 Tax=Watersipora subatra TaxID=2589382 RepID=UPI00355B20CF
MRTTSLLTLSVIVGVCYGVGADTNFLEDGACSSIKMEALQKAYDANAKVLAIKTDLESELLEAIAISESHCGAVTASSTVLPTEELKDKKIRLHRSQIEELMKNLETGKVTVPLANNVQTGVLKSAAERNPQEAADLTIERYLDTLRQINESDALLEAWYKHINLDRSDPRVVQRERAGFWSGDSDVKLTLDCDMQARSKNRPTSVHKLRPGDIDVIGAMGDSITAGFGAGADYIFINEWFHEYRGQSWSAGGDKSYSQGHTTLPNILREFNPELTGYSEGTLKLFGNPLTSSKTQLNVAITGDVAQDMNDQAKNLVEKMRADPDINMKHDWKMVTLFIGANNLCAFCKDEEEHSAKSYIKEIQKGLDILKAEIPRLYVNLVEIFDIVPLTKMAKFELGTITCSLAHSLANVCPCTRDQDDINYKFDAKALRQRALEYQEAIHDLVNSGRYEDEDFTVVVQSFFKNTGPPLDEDGEPDMSYFAQDCFHFSTKGQNRAGIGLWNSLIQPVGRKPTTWDIEETAKCPRMEYLPTKKNSL